MGYLGIAALLILAGGVVLGGRVAVRGAAYPPICGRCGYSLRGGLRRVCPECGSGPGDQSEQSFAAVRRRIRVGWMLVVLGMLTAAVWRLQVWAPPRTAVQPGAVQLVPRSGHYRRIVLSFVDGEGRVSATPEFAHLIVSGTNLAETSVALDTVDAVARDDGHAEGGRAEGGGLSGTDTGVLNSNGPVYGGIYGCLREAAPRASGAEASLDAAELVAIIGDGADSGDPWPSCQGSSRFICRQVSLAHRGVFSLTPGFFIALLASGIVWYGGQYLLIRRAERGLFRDGA